MTYFLFSHVFLFFQAATDASPRVGWLDMLWMLIQTAIALAIVCGLAILIFRYILPRLNVVSFNESIVRVVDGTSLDARKRLVVVEVAGKYLLLAISEAGVQTVTELDGDTVEQAIEQLDEKNKNSKKGFDSVSSSFGKIMDGFRQKRK